MAVPLAVAAAGAAVTLDVAAAAGAADDVEGTVRGAVVLGYDVAVDGAAETDDSGDGDGC